MDRNMYKEIKALAELYRARFDTLTVSERAVVAMSDVLDNLYPDGNPDFEWGSEELGYLAHTTQVHGLIPERE